MIGKWCQIFWKKNIFSKSFTTHLKRLVMLMLLMLHHCCAHIVRLEHGLTNQVLQLLLCGHESKGDPSLLLILPSIEAGSGLCMFNMLRHAESYTVATEGASFLSAEYTHWTITNIIMYTLALGKTYGYSQLEFEGASNTSV